MAVDEGNGTGGPGAEPPRRGFRHSVTTVQSSLSRVVATGGIIGIGTGIAAIMGSQDVDHWIIGIVVSGVTVFLVGLVWSTRIG